MLIPNALIRNGPAGMRKVQIAHASGSKEGASIG